MEEGRQERWSDRAAIDCRVSFFLKFAFRFVESVSIGVKSLLLAVGLRGGVGLS